MAFTEEGRWLRTCTCIATIIHTLLYLLCLAIVGFLPMILNILNAAWAYSCYLTLRERELAVYFVILIGQTVDHVVTIFGDKDLGNVQVLGHLICTTFIVLTGFYVGRAWYHFRKTGGLRGTGPRENLIEDKVYDGAVKAGGKMYEKANTYVDKNITD